MEKMLISSTVAPLVCFWTAQWHFISERGFEGFGSVLDQVHFNTGHLPQDTMGCFSL